LSYTGDNTDAKKNPKIIGRTITPSATVAATKTPIAATTTRNRHATLDEIANHGGGLQSSTLSTMCHGVSGGLTGAATAGVRFSSAGGPLPVA
jgi:hypothetical protein